MKTRNYFMFAVAALALGACNNDNEVTESSDTPVAIQVDGSIKMLTRAAGASWAANDAVGIYMLTTGTATAQAANKKYVTTDGNSGFTTDAANTIYFPIDGSKVDFVAYYPYTATLTGDALAVDVSDQSNQAAIDVMTAAKVTEKDKTTPAVAFNFAHKLSKLVLTIEPGAGMTAPELEGLTVSVTNQRTAGSFNVLTDALTVTASEGATVVLNAAANGTSAEAILLPNDNADNAAIAERKLRLTLKDGKGSFVYDIPNGKGFDAGKKNIYTVAVNRTGLTVTGTITDWTPVDEGNVDANEEEID